MWDDAAQYLSPVARNLINNNNNDSDINDGD
jgi:hypothetical protein